MPDPGFKLGPSSASDAATFHVDQVTMDGLVGLIERVKLAWGTAGSAADVTAANPLPVTDAAAETSLSAIVTKLTSDPATQTTLAAVLAKLPAAPALDATVASLVAANHTDLAAILTRLGQTLTVSQADQTSSPTDGRKTVTTPGTAVALRASLACKWVTVTALPSNTQQVNVGGSDVLATAGSDSGVPLLARDSTTIPVSNANLLFVDARVAGEGVSFLVGA